MPIVLVYLGSRLPIYAALNLRYLRRTFPGQDVWLVSDSASALRVARLLGVHVFECRDVTTAWSGIRERMPFRADFRKGFWFLTFARLYALAEFARAVRPGPFLHVEADVWLSPNFPFSSMLTLEGPCAYPLEDAQAGVASTLLVRSAHDMESVVRQAEQWFEAGEVFTDMGFLGALVARRAMPISVLPSAPPIDGLFRDYVDAEVRSLMAPTKAQGIFDGMAWGWDLLGEDPRNHWGQLRLFRSHYASAIDTTRAAIALDAHGLPVVLDSHGNAHPLHSLHVHSKDLRMFLTPRRRLAQRVRQRTSGGPRSIWLPHVLIRVLWSLGVPWVRRHLPKLTVRG